MVSTYSAGSLLGMAPRPSRDGRRERIASLGAVALLHTLAAWMFISGFGAQIAQGVSDELRTFDVLPEPPPPAAEPPPPKARKVRARKQATPKPEGAASPKNLRDTPVPIVAPKPIVPLPVPPPIVAAPVAGEGLKVSAGAADTPGPGTGSGGLGQGLGSGRYGTGPGGGGGNVAQHARRLRGEIKWSDYPESAFRDNAGGTVAVLYTVGVDGRVHDCRVTQSSGRADLDAATCDALVRRFRYKPARDAYGRPVPERIGRDQTWDAPRDGSGEGATSDEP